MKRRVEYIWVDGTAARQLRSKTRVLEDNTDWIKYWSLQSLLESFESLLGVPPWSFDGSSTGQAVGDRSDCTLRPVCIRPDPLGDRNDLLALCEVLDPQGLPHPSNTRAHCERVAHRFTGHHVWFGIEQEYLFTRDGRVLGWPAEGTPAPQGRYYCAVGADHQAGRHIVDEHLKACLDAGLSVCGTNAEVMLGQWEFQVGPLDPLRVADELWLARYLLERIAGRHGVGVSLAAKPVPGDWNGSGAHTNFSTSAMRDPKSGTAAIAAAVEALRVGAPTLRGKDTYGNDIEARLTGRHETCSWTTFKSGVGDRSASVRIPQHVADAGYGYVEDRRPCADVDPYTVVASITETVCSAADPQCDSPASCG